MRSTSSPRRSRERAYLADRGLATVLHVALALGKPLLLEGEAGVGKTEVAKTLADVLGARLIRLQCYEGIDVAHALYDWSYARQMLDIRLIETATSRRRRRQRARLHDLFGREFLVRRPLLDAIEHDDPVPPVLLIDEIDRADDEFEAFLLELLSDFQVTIPEIGTIRAEQRPVVILTSNRTRELHDALKRRCLYHWIGHPSLEREIAIVRARVPGVPERLAAEAAAFVERLRALDLAKVARRRRDDRLDAGARRARPGGARGRRRRRHARQRAQVPRGSRARARPRAAGARRRGEACGR